MKKYIYFLALIVCIISCVKVKDTKVIEEEVPSLIFMKIEVPNMSSLKHLRMSEFVDSIGYVQLETTENCLLKFTPIIYHVENFFLLSDFFGIYQFNSITGEFLRQIGSRGQGPGEFLNIQNICIDNSKRVIVKDHAKQQHLMAFDYEGKSLNKIEFDSSDDSIFSTLFYSLSLIDINNEFMTYFAKMMPAGDAVQPNEIIVYDYINKKIIHTNPNRLKGKYERNSNQFGGIRTITKHEDKIFYKSFYNDTLYSIHNENGIKPYAVIDLGIRKVTDETYLSRNFMTDISGRLLIDDLFINHDCILFRCFSFDNTYDFICKYDKSTGEMTYHPSLINNDIDGGANIGLYKLSGEICEVFPEYEVDNSEDKKRFFYTLDKSELKFPELQDKFKHMQDARDPEDNPLIMILHKKKK